MERAFACICSIAVIARALTFLRSLEDVGALTDAACYVLCLDAQSPPLIRQYAASPNIHLLTLADLPDVQSFTDRRINQLTFACKPFLLRKILTELGATKVIYMDADTWLVSNPVFLWSEL